MTFCDVRVYIIIIYIQTMMIIRCVIQDARSCSRCVIFMMIILYYILSLGIRLIIRFRFYTVRFIFSVFREKKNEVLKSVSK